MTNATPLSAVAQLLGQLQIACCGAVTRSTDLTFRRLLHDVQIAHGHLQYAIREYLQNNGLATDQPATADLRQILEQQCFTPNG